MVPPPWEDDEAELEDGPIEVVTFGEQGPPGPGASLPLGSTDITGGVVIIAANALTWNRSASAIENNHELSADTTNWPHIVGWKSGVPPTITAPAGWKLLDPVTGELTAAGGTFVYGSGGNGPGESYDWTSSVAELVFWARG